MAETHFRKRLQTALERKGWTLNQLRTALGEGTGFYDKVNRPDPSFALVARIADALGVTTEWLGSGRGPMLAPPRSDVVKSDILWEGALPEMPEFHTTADGDASGGGPGLRITHSEKAIRAALDSYSFVRGYGWTGGEDWHSHGQDFGRAIVAPLRALGINADRLRQPTLDQYATAMALAVEIVIAGDFQALLDG